MHCMIHTMYLFNKMASEFSISVDFLKTIILSRYIPIYQSSIGTDTDDLSNLGIPILCTPFYSTYLLWWSPESDGYPYVSLQESISCIM